MKPENMEITFNVFYECFKIAIKKKKRKDWTITKHRLSKLPKLLQSFRNEDYETILHGENVEPVVREANVEVKEVVDDLEFIKDLFSANQGLNKLAHIWYRQGLAYRAHKLLHSVLFTAYKHRTIKLPGSKFKLQTYSYPRFFSLLFRTLTNLSMPLKLVPRFIKKRVRKIPISAKVSFHRNNMWRNLFKLGKIAYGQAVNKMADEVVKIAVRHKSSVVLSKLPQFYKDIDKAKVYLRKRRAMPNDYKKAYKFLNAVVKPTLPLADKRNKQLFQMLALNYLKHEPKHVRYFVSKVTILKLKLYKNKAFVGALHQILAIFYGYTTNPFKLINARS
jgi:hypothetical protein